MKFGSGRQRKKKSRRLAGERPKSEVPVEIGRGLVFAEMP
jgi:hypothetical protein